MQKSYVVKSPINFANFSFFVRVGDILVHDPANGNRLTVYRGGDIVKAINQTSLGMAALVKQGFVTELLVSAAPPPVIVAPKAPEVAKKPPVVVKKEEPKPVVKPEPKVEVKVKAKAAEVEVEVQPEEI